jgi:glycosyltransferase involved in cell wall biosynthesis
MKIDVLCRDGSPLGVSLKTLWGDDPNQIGCGGSEYGLLTLCEEWSKRGYQVRLYNDPRIPCTKPFEQLSTGAFDPNADRDVLVVFRSPNPRSIVAKGLKVWLSCDQFTVDDFANFSSFMDKIVCISPRHVQYFKDTYNIQKAQWIDLPIRTKDFHGLNVDRVPNQLLFSSVPERGLMNTWRMWPKILEKVPDAHLYITSDYRLWGPGGDGGNILHRLKWVNTHNVSFLGAVPRQRLVDLELQSDALFYPSNYDEMMCIAVAEAECVGCYPITSDTGALVTTNLGMALPYNAEVPANDGMFVDALVHFLTHPDKEAIRKQLISHSLHRFSEKVILDKWDKEVFN